MKRCIYKRSYKKWSELHASINYTRVRNKLFYVILQYSQCTLSYTTASWICCNPNGAMKMPQHLTIQINAMHATRNPLLWVKLIILMRHDWGAFTIFRLLYSLAVVLCNGLYLAVMFRTFKAFPCTVYPQTHNWFDNLSNVIHKKDLEFYI